LSLGLEYINHKTKKMKNSMKTISVLIAIGLISCSSQDGNGIAKAYAPQNESKVESYEETIEMDDEEFLVKVAPVSADEVLTEEDVKILNSKTGLKHLISYSKLDLKKTIRYVNYENYLDELQVELIQLHNWVINNNKKLIVIFEGRDSAGKGGAIRRITEHINPRHFKVSIKGYKKLTLVVNDGNDGINSDHANWLNMRLTP